MIYPKNIVSSYNNYVITFMQISMYNAHNYVGIEDKQ